jgi:hypothetical protein
MSDTKLDPRLTDFSWEERRAAPVARLIDPHVHHTGKPEDTDQLMVVADRYHVESLNLIFWDKFKSDIKMAGKWGKIGERIIPYLELDLTKNDTSAVDAAYDLGYWGLKFICPQRAYDDRFYEPLLTRAEELGMPCLFHTGVLGTPEEKRRVGCGMSLMRADMLDTIANRHPELLIQGAHLGNPDAATAIRTAQYSPNLLWDTSGGIRFVMEANPLLFHTAVHHIGTAWNSIMWSTDTTTGLFPPQWADGWPTQFEYQLCMWQKILAAQPVKPTTEQLDKYFYGNARRRLDAIQKKRKA